MMTESLLSFSHDDGKILYVIQATEFRTSTGTTYTLTTIDECGHLTVRCANREECKNKAINVLHCMLAELQKHYGPV